MLSHESTGQSLHLFRDSVDAIDAAVLDLTAAAERAVRQRGRAVLAIATSPECELLCRRWSELGEGWAFWPYLLMFEAVQPVGLHPGDDAAGDGDDFRRMLPVSAANTFAIPRTGSISDDTTRFERTMRMALELRPDQRPRFDRVVCEITSDGSCAGTAADDWNPVVAGPLAHAGRAPGSRVGLSTATIGGTAKLVLLPGVADAAHLVRMWSDPDDPVLRPMRGALAIRGTPVALYAASRSLR